MCFEVMMADIDVGIVVQNDLENVWDWLFSHCSAALGLV